MRQIIIACALIGLLAASAPHFLSRQSPEGRIPAAAESAEQPVSVNLARTVEVKADSDGHFYLEGDVNWRPVRFMVDTGATVVALRQSDAEAAGIRLRPGEFDQPVGTANGVTYAAAVELDTVAVEDVEVEAVRALVLPDAQLGISLLGGSFLNRLQRFEVADGTLRFEN